jgi:hypothetical protein
MRTIRTLSQAAIDCDGEVKAARAALTAASEDGAQATRLANQLNDLAVREGRLGVVVQVVAMDAQGCAPDTIRKWLTRTLLAGSDDTWSGRTNDVRRARFDGVREAASEILDYLTAQVDATV